MRRIWEKSSGYSFWRHYVDFCTRASFSSVEISGLERMPREGAVLLAPNHRAALMDPLLVLLLRKGPTGFGARADIFRKPRMAAILRWLRILRSPAKGTGCRQSQRTGRYSTKSSTASPTECLSACSAKARTGRSAG